MQCGKHEQQEIQQVVEHAQNEKNFAQAAPQAHAFLLLSADPSEILNVLVRFRLQVNRTI